VWQTNELWAGPRSMDPSINCQLIEQIRFWAVMIIINYLRHQQDRLFIRIQSKKSCLWHILFHGVCLQRIWSCKQILSVGHFISVSSLVYQFNGTGWRRCIGSLKLQFFLRKRATYRVLARNHIWGRGLIKGGPEPLERSIKQLRGEISDSSALCTPIGKTALSIKPWQ